MDEFVVIKVMNEATLRALKEKNGDYSKNKRNFRRRSMFF